MVRIQSSPQEFIKMIVKIEACHLIDNCYIRRGYCWSALTLIEACKDLEVFDLPLSGIRIDELYWKIESTKDFIYHAKRVQETDEQYPIIIDDEGIIADGWHRVVKAILSGKETIKAKRLQVMPSYDSYKKPKK